VPDAFGSSYEEESVQDDDFFVKRIENGTVFGCFIKGNLVGTMGYYIDNHIKCAHIATIWGVYVKPENRGKDISKNLFDALQKDLPKEIEQIRISVGLHNAPAKRVYERCGFIACGIEERVIKIGDQYYDEILMVKFLR